LSLVTVPELIAVVGPACVLLLTLLAVLVARGRGGFPARFLLCSLAMLALLGPLALVTLWALPALSLIPFISALLASESFWRGLRLYMLCRAGSEAACREVEEVRRRLRERGLLGPGST
jgi:hypothetical protein